jgi:EAL domain-containing protein (putative c-di-GMP-specific phosphodiesterase class I)/cellobiose-specific phosphotransferase system component IIC
MKIPTLLTHLSKNRITQNTVASTISIMPYSMIRAIIVVISTLASSMGYTKTFDWLNNLQLSMLTLMPIIINVLFSFHWATKNKTSVILSMATSLTALMIVTGMFSNETTFYLNTSIPISIGISIAVNIIIEKTSSVIRKWKNKIFSNLIISSTPLMFVTLTSICIKLYLPSDLHNTYLSISGLIYPDSYLNGLLYELARGVTWFLGIHGQLMFQDVGYEFIKQSNINIQAWEKGGAHLNILNQSFYDVWCSTGGTGSTLSLLVCLMFSNAHQYKKLIRIALPLSFFNINEPLIFGFPIVLNPIMVIPFLMTPLVNYSIAYAATACGLIEPMHHLVGWATPPLINSWIASGGNSTVVALQVFLIALGSFIYYPFFYMMEKMTSLKITDATSRIPTIDSQSQKSSLDINLISNHHHLNEFDEITEAQYQIKKLTTSGNFILYFQPQVRVFDRKITALEVLLRHEDKNGKITPPYFLSYYERLNLMPEMDFWVLENAIAHTRSHFEKFSGMTLSINISPQTITDPRLLLIVDGALKDGMPTGWSLELEITESQKIKNPEELGCIINIFRNKGIRIALDDFGSGYSTLSYLLKYQLDKIKLDRTLVTGLSLPHGSNFLKQVVTLGRTACPHILIEGVETELEYDECMNSGVDSIQGFLFYRPMPSDELTKLLSKQSSIT